MSVVDDYISELDNPQKLALENICQIVRRTIPEATEVITYGMPGFKYKGKYLISLGAFKNHMSIFPGAGAIESNKESLRTFTTSKGTIQFTFDKPIPKETLELIIMHRVKEINETN